jgi:hypothetical protein
MRETAAAQAPMARERETTAAAVTTLWRR